MMTKEEVDALTDEQFGVLLTLVQSRVTHNGSCSPDHDHSESYYLGERCSICKEDCFPEFHAE